MAKPFLVPWFAAAALLAPSLSALGEDQAPARTAWTKADPASDEVVRWVVEGCAAYPVTADAEQAKADPGSKTDVTADAGLALEAA
jgi:hypothetical protein